jgi:hypothetical protein
MDKWRRRGDRSESHESPYVPNAFDHLSATKRSNHNTSPEAGTDRTNLSGRKALNPSPDAQERPLEGITHLHQAESQ